MTTFGCVPRFRFGKYSAGEDWHWWYMAFSMIFRASTASQSRAHWSATMRISPRLTSGSSTLICPLW